MSNVPNMYDLVIKYFEMFGLLKWVPSDTVTFIQWFMIVIAALALVRFILAGFYKLCGLVSYDRW